MEAWPAQNWCIGYELGPPRFYDVLRVGLKVHEGDVAVAAFDIRHIVTVKADVLGELDLRPAALLQ